MRKIKKILFVGAGAMAEAMIAGISKSSCASAYSIYVTNKSNLKRLQNLNERYHIESINLQHTDIDDFDVIILAIKPKNVNEVISTLQQSIQSRQLLLSVVAGISISYLQNHFLKSNQSFGPCRIPQVPLVNQQQEYRSVHLVRTNIYRLLKNY